MFIDVGQGVGPCAIGNRYGSRVVIDGQGRDPATGKPFPIDGSVCLNYSGMTRRFADPDFTLDVSNSYNMDVFHTGKQSFKTTVINSEIGLTLSAATNDITLVSSSTIRLNLAKGCGQVNLALTGTPEVTKNPYGTYSIQGENGQFIEMTAASINLVKINGKAMSGYLPAEPKSDLAATEMPIEEGPTDEAPVENEATTAQKQSDLLTFNKGSNTVYIADQLTKQAEANSSTNSTQQPTVQNNFPPNLPPAYQMLFMFLGMLQQQYTPSNQPSAASPFNQQRYLPWW